MAVAAAAVAVAAAVVAVAAAVVAEAACCGGGGCCSCGDGGGLDWLNRPPLPLLRLGEGERSPVPDAAPTGSPVWGWMLQLAENHPSQCHRPRGRVGEIGYVVHSRVPCKVAEGSNLLRVGGWVGARVGA